MTLRLHEEVPPFSACLRARKWVYALFISLRYSNFSTTISISKLMIPVPWESCTMCEMPQVPPRNFHEIFWNIVHTYVGHCCESFRLLKENATSLSKSLVDGAACPHEALHPVLPSQLLKVGAIPSLVPMEDLPVVDCCEDVEAITKLRLLCSRYGENVRNLLSVVGRCDSKWGRLTYCERKELASAIMQERSSRVQEDELRACFSDLIFSGKGLCQMTSDVTRFSNLTKLVLSNNPQLTSISYLPPSCLVLIACGCSIREVCSSSTLCFLGLAYNAVVQLDFLGGLPELRVLDLTRNGVSSIEETVGALQAHLLLEDVTFLGCPVALQDGFREHILGSCTRLQRLDHIPVVGSMKAQESIVNPLVTEARATIETFTESVENKSCVVLSVKLAQLAGLTSLTHTPIPREERPMTDRSERGLRGKRKSKSIAVGPTYELDTTLSLHGLWGDGDGVVLSCKDISLLQSVLPSSQQQQQQQQRTKKGRLQSVLPPVANVLVLDHLVTKIVSPTPELSRSLARVFPLELQVHDTILFSSGNSVVLTCNIGSFFADGSSLLSSNTIPVRSIDLNEPLVISQAALEEKWVHACELREKTAVAMEKISLPAVNSPELSGAPHGNNTPSTRRRKKSMVPGCTIGGDLTAEEMRRRVEVEELNLLASIEERRAQELQKLALTVSLKLSLGSAPKAPEEEPPTRTKGSRHRQGDRAKQ